MNCKYLIIGQGLAGSLLSYSLLKRGISFLVLDDEANFTSSIVAGGIYNPVTGRRMVKTWRVEDLLPFMEKTYLELEELLQIKFLRRSKILRILSNTHEIGVFAKKQAQPDTMGYIGQCFEHIPIQGIKKFPGSCEILGGGSLNVNAFIYSYRNFLKKENLFLEESFDYTQLELTDSKITYKNISADKIIFCEGYKAASLNPYFNYLPFNNVKGEILTIEIPGFETEYIINKGLLLSPIENNLFTAGGTYNWDDMTELTTEAGKQELIAKLDELLSIPYKIISHNAGIRPAVHDRRPLIGSHYQYPQIGIMNGLGTKGVLLSPWLADHFIEHMEDNKPIDNEIDIKRFNHFMLS